MFTVTVIALALLRAAENAIAGLLALQEIFREGSDALFETGSEFLSLAATGQLSPAIDYSEDLIEVVAHLTRVNRTINLLKDFSLRF